MASRTDPGIRTPMLGQYEILAEIASGGMARVLLARLPGAGGFERLFAIKLIRPELASHPALIDRLLDEARIAAQIYHTKVVGIQAISESAEHGYYLVMEYIEGFTLADVNRTASTSPAWWSIVLRVLIDALEGLHAAHTLVGHDGTVLEVVHRDMSPQNILVGTDGFSRVADFGIAKAVGRISTTVAGQFLGKSAYMSPEQVRGQSVDARSDLFSTGVVLWEALTQQRLFYSTDRLETVRKVTVLPIRSPREIVPTVPAGLDAVCMRALERDMAKRFASAHEMATALEDVARREKLLVTEREVAGWLSQHFGPQIMARREAVRTASRRMQTESFNLSHLPSLDDVGPADRSTERTLTAPPDVVAVAPTAPLTVNSTTRGDSSSAPSIVDLAGASHADDDEDAVTTTGSLAIRLHARVMRSAANTEGDDEARTKLMRGEALKAAAAAMAREAHPSVGDDADDEGLTTLAPRKRLMAAAGDAGAPIHLANASGGSSVAPTQAPAPTPSASSRSRRWMLFAAVVPVAAAIAWVLQHARR